MSIDVCVECYEGPMDILLELVTKKKIDIYEISISQITKQYIQKIKNLKHFNMELASDFILMASKLLEIKSRYMLYIDLEEDEDPRIELYESIKEYAKYKHASLILKERINKSHFRYYKPALEIYLEEVLDLTNLKLSDLLNNYPKTKIKFKQEMILFTKKIISIEEKINEIRKILEKNSFFYFDEIIESIQKEEKIASILGILELAREKEAFITQEFHLERIHVQRWNNGE